jgi:hypothetical protein
VLQRVQQKGNERGKQDIPTDLFDFMQRADVIYLDEENQPVRFVRAIVTWEDH